MKRYKRTEITVELWKQIQSMVQEVESRNYNLLSFSAIVATIGLILGLLGEKSYSQSTYVFLLIPAIALLGLFYGAYNCKVSAILRGYLAGIEDVLNSYIKKNLFIYNKGYSPLFRGIYFLTNSSIPVIFTVIILIIVGFCFYRSFQHFNESSHIYLAVYAFVWCAIASIFASDLWSNSATKKRARLYFLEYYFMNPLQPDAASIRTLIETDVRNIPMLLKKYKRINKKSIKSL